MTDIYYIKNKINKLLIGLNKDEKDKIIQRIIENKKTKEKAIDP